MKPASHITLLAAARAYTPLIVLMALLSLATWSPGTGVGFVAGLVFAMALLTHLLVFGAGAARAAFPPMLTQVLLALGLAATAIAAGTPRFPFSLSLMEAGLFAVTASGLSLVFAALVGRAPTLRDEDA